MKFASHASSGFWTLYDALPQDAKRQADKAYELFKTNPAHPSLALKKVGPYWSVRLSLDFRALALQKGSSFYWFWIGPHDDYENLLRRG